ncbi:hypothetical protein C2I27_04620 [Priestia megaterium]|uniref:hypothetical protein n=1 Tax=Priestia TaxID=2800373 RepID=UPI000D508DEC|nr:hypothetical protein [Priestia megaterium]PVC73794.1 hypothetical protein C2I27_04620 [Priestia megaterium]
MANPNKRTGCPKEKHLCNCTKHKTKDKAVVGEVAGTLPTVVIGATVRLPLTFRLFKTPKITIIPDGGIRVEEDGEYFVTFSAIFPNDIAFPNVVFSIYSPDFSGTALTGEGTANYSELVCLRKGDTVYVTITNNTGAPIPLPNADNIGVTGLLNVIKVGD